MHLPRPICDRYLTLHCSLEELQEQTDANKAIELHAKLQTQLQALLATLSPPERQQLQRYNTEIFKELQLLGPDLMKLQLLKQSAKQEQLLMRVTQRCARLRGYITNLLASNSEH